MYTVVNKMFSDWLFFELQQRDMSQADLARASGITRGGISNLLNQVRKPDPDTCIAIAKALKLAPETVFRAAGMLPPPPPDEPPTLAEWIQIFLQADPDTREELLQYAQYRADQERKTKRRGSSPVDQTVD